MTWSDGPEHLRQLIDALAPLDRSVAESLSEKDQVPGYCPACRQTTQFKVTAGQEQAGEWRNLLEGMICRCGTNGRTRLATAAWRSVRQALKPTRSLMFERVTPLYSVFASEDNQLESCEYLGPDKEPGGDYDFAGLRIRHEDMTSLSCGDETYDLIMHFDVLEHVPDHRKAIKECYRSLRCGGAMLFTVPFFHGLDRNLVRAQLTDDGIEHFLPPAYHGNPVGDGALVFVHPGWKLFEDLAAVGFHTLVGLQYNPTIGIVSNGCPFPDGHMWPVVFLSMKR